MYSTTYLLVAPWDMKHLEPLAERLTEAGTLYLRKHQHLPNVALISGGDWEDALVLTGNGRTTFTTTIDNKRARIRLEPSPFGGQGRDVYVGRQ